MATGSTDRNFSAALLYALKYIGRPNLSLKKEQLLSVETIYDGRRCLVVVCISTVLDKSVALFASTKSLHNRKTRLDMLKLV